MGYLKPFGVGFSAFGFSETDESSTVGSASTSASLAASSVWEGSGKSLAMDCWHWLSVSFCCDWLAALPGFLPRCDFLALVFGSGSGWTALDFDSGSGLTSVLPDGRSTSGSGFGDSFTRDDSSCRDFSSGSGFGDSFSSGDSSCREFSAGFGFSDSLSSGDSSCRDFSATTSSSFTSSVSDEIFLASAHDFGSTSSAESGATSSGPSAITSSLFPSSGSRGPVSGPSSAPSSSGFRSHESSCAVSGMSLSTSFSTDGTSDCFLSQDSPSSSDKFEDPLRGMLGFSSSTALSPFVSHLATSCRRRLRPLPASGFFSAPLLALPE
mmetsp:Transcript_12371/g.26884  ORF Transcript_12371/g.26884 Transcript_12371/m.26884 type:complete len:324 (-) Transcript_12371:477-1448(-)